MLLGTCEILKIMNMLPSRTDSYEHIMHDTAIPRFLLDFRDQRRPARRVVEALSSTPRLERFIGVIYKPETERWSHYVEANLPQQFDAYVWFDETSAVHAFETAQPKERPSMGETYPFGL